MHHDGDSGNNENALGLTEDELKIREVRRVNIREIKNVKSVPLAADHVPKSVDRGPIGPDWLEDGKTKPLMCCYKVVKLNVALWPVQEQVEQYMLRTQVEKGISEIAVRAWAWLDEYINMDEKGLEEFKAGVTQRLAAMQGESSEIKEKKGDEKVIDEDGKEEKKGLSELEDDDTPTCHMIPEFKISAVALSRIAGARTKLATLLDMFRKPLNFGGNTTSAPPIVLEPKVPPAWVPDLKVTHCTGCKKEFGLLVRKHHCRGCGMVMCHACTNQSRVLSQYNEYFGPNPQRICKECSAEQDQMEAKARRRAELQSKLRSPQELEIRRQIRERAREFAKEQAAKRERERSLSISLRIMLLFAILVVILAVYLAWQWSELGFVSAMYYESVDSLRPASTTRIQ